jgi:hypothetical protein
LIYCFSEEPIEEWAKKSLWGTDSKTNPANATLEQVETQIHDLFELLISFNVKCGYYETTYPALNESFSQDRHPLGIGLRIEVGALFKDNTSKFRITNLRVRTKEIRIDEKNLILPAYDEIKVVDGKTCIDHVWSWDELKKRFSVQIKAPPDYNYGNNGDFDCTIVFDLDGDEKSLFPSDEKAQRRNGTFHICYPIQLDLSQ